jgi:hypothetical protein
MVPRSFREQQRVSRQKAESVASRLDRLEEYVDKIHFKIFGVNATTTASISKAEK